MSVFDCSLSAWLTLFLLYIVHVREAEFLKVTDLGKCVTRQTVFITLTSECLYLNFLRNTTFIVFVLVLMCHCNK